MFYEAVIQFGNIDNSAVGTEGGEVAKKMLDEYMKNFEKRNPNLIVFNAVMHLDEATPHLHISFVPVLHIIKAEVLKQECRSKKLWRKWTLRQKQKN